MKKMEKKGKNDFGKSDVKNVHTGNLLLYI